MGSKVNQESRRWFGRTIPYVIDNSVESLRGIIEGDGVDPGAIGLIQASTHLRFLRRKNQDDYIRFIDGDGCSSPVERQGGRQDIHLNRRDCANRGVVIHEICHALGMFHEQSRRDRDRLVDIHFGNIEDGEVHNFEKYSANDGREYGLYDYGSIMHYGNCAFAREGYYWTSGWTTAISYRLAGMLYLLILKRSGFGAGGNNVHVHRLHASGRVESRVASYKWTEGWTSVLTFQSDGNTYLFILKASGFGSDGNNVHIHRLNGDGSVGARMASYKWTEGWTTAITYEADASSYLLLIKKNDFGADGNNSHVHILNSDGTVGARVAAYRWTEGWTSACIWPGGGRVYLLLLKETGFGADDKNVHIHVVENNGSIGARVASYRWTSGWTTVMSYQAGGGHFLFLLKAIGSGADRNNVHLHQLNADGTVGTRIASYLWTERWSTAITYAANDGRLVLFLLKSIGTGADGNNVHLHRLNVDGTVGDRMNACPTLTVKSGANAALYTGNPNAIGNRVGLSPSDAETLDTLPRGHLHVHLLAADGAVGRRRDTQAWTNGWTTGVIYDIGTSTFLLLIKNIGAGADEKNVHLHQMNTDGTVGDRVTSYKWTEGWTHAPIYRIGGKLYLLLSKLEGFGSDGKNVHIHSINADGTIGQRLGQYKWSEGWSSLVPYMIGEKNYLFLLKASGQGNDGKNVHIHLLTDNETVGNRVASYNWSEGWTTVLVYTLGGATFLFLMKASGFGNDDKNVHIHRLNEDGTVGPRTASYKWTQGWTSACIYASAGGLRILILKNHGYGSDGKNVHIHAINDNGSIGTRIASYAWTQSWSTVVPFTRAAFQFLMLLRVAYPLS